MAAAVVPPYYFVDDKEERLLLDEYLVSAQLGLIGWVNNFYAENRGAGEAGADYFGAVEAKNLDWNPFTHYWSLSVEEQFYFCFPLIALLAAGKQRSNVSGKQRTQVADSAPQGQKEQQVDTHVRFATVLGILCLLSTVLCAMLTYSSANRLAFYLMPARFWQLISGALLHALLSMMDAEEGILSATSPGLSLLSVILFAVAFAFTEGKRGFPFPWSLFAVCGTLCFIAAGSHGKSPPFNRLLAQPAFVYVGKLSYPLYLWHWPLLVAASWVSDHASLDAHVRTPLVSIAMVAVSVVLSALTYHFVEDRFRKWRPVSNWRILFLLLPLIGAVELWTALLRGPLEGDLCIVNCKPVVPSHTIANHRISTILSTNVSSTLNTSECNTTALELMRGYSAASTCTDRFQDMQAASEGTRVNIAKPPAAVAIGVVAQAPVCYSTEHPNPTWPAFRRSACFGNSDSWSNYRGLYGVDEGLRRVVDDCLGEGVIAGHAQTCGSKNVFLLGDSHAGSLLHGLEYAVNRSATVTGFRFLAAVCNTALQNLDNPGP